MIASFIQGTVIVKQKGRALAFKKRVYEVRRQNELRELERIKDLMESKKNAIDFRSQQLTVTLKQLDFSQSGRPRPDSAGSPGRPRTRSELPVSIWRQTMAAVRTKHAVSIQREINRERKEFADLTLAHSRVARAVRSSVEGARIARDLQEGLKALARRQRGTREEDESLDCQNAARVHTLRAPLERIQLGHPEVPQRIADTSCSPFSGALAEAAHPSSDRVSGIRDVDVPQIVSAGLPLQGHEAQGRRFLPDESDSSDLRLKGAIQVRPDHTFFSSSEISAPYASAPPEIQHRHIVTPPGAGVEVSFQIGSSEESINVMVRQVEETISLVLTVRGHCHPIECASFRKDLYSALSEAGLKVDHLRVTRLAGQKFRESGSHG